MCEWEGPVRRTFRNLAVAIVFTAIMMVISLFVIGTILDYIISAIVLFMLLYIMILAYRTYQLPKVNDHIFSRWDLDKDFVASRIDTAIKRKGVNVVVGYKGETVIFPFPPLSIVVAPERSRTTVYVGPVTDASPQRVEALKVFVHGALGKRSSVA